MCKVIAYYRVSTEAQGRSGLGLDAQRQAVMALCQTRGWQIMAEYTEVESGKIADREQLTAALHHAKVTGGTLVIAKLDRLSRNAAFITALQDSGAKFIAADMPEANELTVHIMAAVAQAERQAIAKRTREALAAAKVRGVKLGNPNGAAAIRRAAKGNGASLQAIKGNADAFASDLAPIVDRLRSEGLTSLPQIARGLNEGGFATPRGGKWHPSSVSNLLRRLEGVN
jgi:DNA invertase Pin-like site-specific DNA recombinase